MLSTTTHLTTDIVAMPLLWVLPLGLYLLSFVIAFAERRRGLAKFITMLAPLVILIAGGLAFSDGHAATPSSRLTLGPAAAVHRSRSRSIRRCSGCGPRSAISPASISPCRSAACSAACSARSSRRSLFDWAYEHPLLMLAAALLVPQYVLVPWPERYDGVLRLVLP